MNRRLFQSWHGVIAAAIVVSYLIWKFAANIPIGRAPGYDRTFLLATGWTSLALFLLVLLHVSRKYVHKLGISPEFKMKVPIRDLEKAETELNAIRRAVAGGTLTDREDILRAARAALQNNRVQRVLRIEVEQNTEGGDPAWRVLALPTFPLGKMFRWMHAHLYYGAAAGLLVLLHGGGALQAGLGGILTVLSLLVVASGLVGIWFWATGPVRMTREERDVSAEKAFALNENLERKVRTAYGDVASSLHDELRSLEKAGDDFVERASSLAQKHRGSPGLTDLLALLGQRHRVARELERLTRRKLLMHAWRVLHVPIAIVLLAFVVIHVVAVLRY